MPQYDRPVTEGDVVMYKKYRFTVYFRRITTSEETAPGYLIPDEKWGVMATTSDEAWQLFLEGVPVDQRDWYKQTRVPECIKPEEM